MAYGSRPPLHGSSPLRQTLHRSGRQSPLPKDQQRGPTAGPALFHESPCRCALIILYRYPPVRPQVTCHGHITPLIPCPGRARNHLCYKVQTVSSAVARAPTPQYAPRCLAPGWARVHMAGACFCGAGLRCRAQPPVSEIIAPHNRSSCNSRLNTILNYGIPQRFGWVALPWSPNTLAPLVSPCWQRKGNFKTRRPKHTKSSKWLGWGGHWTAGSVHRWPRPQTLVSGPRTCLGWPASVTKGGTKDAVPHLL